MEITRLLQVLIHTFNIKASLLTGETTMQMERVLANQVPMEWIH
jgi:hypothetical protein